MKIKSLGQVFTPLYIVDFMLDEIGFLGSNLLDKKIMEPSAGDGNFVIQIFRRYLEEMSKNGKLTKFKILNTIKNIYAIELDKMHYEILLKNIVNEIYKHTNEKIISTSELSNELKKTILNENTLLKTHMDVKFDFIIGNPPYVRLHNLEKNELNFLRKKYDSMKKGSVDLYYAFFEWGINNLSKNGVMGFITPNNFLNNSSGFFLREIIISKITSIYNFQSEKIFENASTYNSITFLKNDSDQIKAYLPRTMDYKVVKGNVKKIFMLKDKLIISDGDWISKFLNSKKPNLTFKNGLATLKDDIFITSNFKKNDNKTYIFNGHLIEKELIKPIVKISTSFNSLKERVCIFPYKIINNKIVGMTIDDLKKYPFANKYFMLMKDQLKNRSLDSSSEWFHFGRSQAINSISHDKIILKNLIKDKVEYNFIPKGTLVYSGLYSEYEDKKQVEKFMSSKKLFDYIRIVGFDKRGKYKVITSSLLKVLWEYGK